MDYDLAQAIFRNWGEGYKVNEIQLYKAAQELDLNPNECLREARFYTVLDSYLDRGGEMLESEKAYLSNSIGSSLNDIKKVASLCSEEEFILKCLLENNFVPDKQKLAFMDQTQPEGVVQQQPDLREMVQNNPELIGQLVQPDQKGQMMARPSPSAPQQLPPSQSGNYDQLLWNEQNKPQIQQQEEEQMKQQMLQQNPAPQGNKEQLTMLYQQMTAEEKVQHSLPQCPPDQLQEVVEKITQVEQQAGTPITDPKQIQKIYQEIAKLQTKKVDEAIKQISQQAQTEMQPQQNFGPIPQRLQQGQSQTEQQPVMKQAAFKDLKKATKIGLTSAGIAAGTSVAGVGAHYAYNKMKEADIKDIPPQTLAALGTALGTAGAVGLKRLLTRESMIGKGLRQASKSLSGATLGAGTGALQGAGINILNPINPTMGAVDDNDTAKDSWKRGIRGGALGGALVGGLQGLHKGPYGITAPSSTAAGFGAGTLASMFGKGDNLRESVRLKTHKNKEANLLKFMGKGAFGGGIAGGVLGAASNPEDRKGGAYEGAKKGLITGGALMGISKGLANKSNSYNPKIMELTKKLRDGMGAKEFDTIRNSRSTLMKKQNIIDNLSEISELSAAPASALAGVYKPKEKKAGVVNNLAHAAPHLNEVAGLGILAAPSVQSLRGKHMSERNKDLMEVGGLGVLAGPSMYHAGKSLLSKAAPIVSKLANFQEYPEECNTIRIAKQLDLLKTFQYKEKQAGFGSSLMSMFKKAPTAISQATPVSQARAQLGAMTNAINTGAKARGMQAGVLGPENAHLNKALVNQRINVGKVEQGMTPELMNRSNEFQMRGGVDKLTQKYEDRLVNNPSFHKQMDSVALQDPTVSPMRKMQIEEINNPIQRLPSQQPIQPTYENTSNLSQTFLPKKQVGNQEYLDPPTTSGSSAKTMRMSQKEMNKLLNNFT